MNHQQALTKISQNFKGIIDTTLREGEQFAGPAEIRGGRIKFRPVEFSPTQAKKILQILNSIGIKYAEVCNPLAQGMIRFVTNLVKLKSRPKLLAQIRNHPDDFQAAVKTGADGVNILVTAEENRLQSMGYDLGSYLKQLEGIITTAHQGKLETRVYAERSWDSKLEVLMKIYHLAAKLGVNTIGIADTVGRSTHWQVTGKIKSIRRDLPNIDIKIHFHNDFLSAVANSIEALAHGANWVDTTLGGFGERSGITPLSVFLARLYELDPQLVASYQTQKVAQAETFVSKVIGVPLPPNLITAPNAFTHKAGIHLNGIRKHGHSLYEPIPPRIIGNSRHLLTGSRISGRTTAAQVREFYRLYGRD